MKHGSQRILGLSGGGKLLLQTLNPFTLDLREHGADRIMDDELKQAARLLVGVSVRVAGGIRVPVSPAMGLVDLEKSHAQTKIAHLDRLGERADVEGTNKTVPFGAGGEHLVELGAVILAATIHALGFADVIHAAHGAERGGRLAPAERSLRHPDHIQPEMGLVLKQAARRFVDSSLRQTFASFHKRRVVRQLDGSFIG